MPIEQVGVAAIVRGAAAYVTDANRVNEATARMGRTSQVAARQTIEATTGIDRAYKSAAESAEVFARESQRQLQASAEALRGYGEALTQIGTRAVVFGAALAAPATAAVAMAISFESAFTGVAKTVDATDEQLETIREGLLDLSTALPVTANELANVAAAAGQLGVAQQYVVGFTETVVKLGETTNLTSEEAAVGLARFANIIQFPLERVGELGSVIVELGNTSATTEAEILDLGLRIAGAGQIVGLSADQIFAFASGLSSVGINAEAGGTAISRTFVEIAKAVRSGGKVLDGFAATAGMSAEEFRTAFERDAAGAVISFIEGLGELGDAGRDVFGVLEEVGLADIRVRDTLLRAAGAGDLLRGSLESAATAMAENTALNDEYQRRVETVAAQLQLLRNAIQVALIDAGTAALPVIRGIVDLLQGLVGAFSALPQPLQTMIILVTGLVGAMVAFGGVAAIFVGQILQAAAAFITLLPQIVAARGALASFSVALVTTPAGLAALAGGLLLAAGAYAIFGRSADDASRAQERQARVSAISAAVQGEEQQQIRDTITALRDQIAAKRELLAAESESARNYQDLKKARDLRIEIEDLTATLKGFEQGLNDSISTQKSMEKALAGVDEALAGTGDSANQLTGEIRRIAPATLLADAALAVFAAKGVGRMMLMVEAATLYRKALEESISIAEIEQQIAALADPGGTLAALLASIGGGGGGGSTRESEAVRQAEREAEERVRIAEDLARRIADAERRMADERVRQLDLVGGLVVSALRAQADEQLDLQLGFVDQARQLYERYYQDRRSQIERERDAAVRAIEDERDARIDAINEQINAINELSAAEERTDLERAVALAFDPQQRAEAEKRLRQFDRARQQEDLREEISAITEAAQERIAAEQQGATDRLALLDAEAEAQRASFDAQEQAARDTYAAITEQYALEAAARVALEQQAQEDIVALLESFAPQWRTAGLSLGEQLAAGIREGSAGGIVGPALAGVPGRPEQTAAGTEQDALIAGLQAQGARAAAGGAPEKVLAAMRERLADLGARAEFYYGGVVPGAPSQAVPIIAHGQERIIPYAGRNGAESGGMVIERGAFEGMFAGATFAGSAEENARAIRDSLSDMLDEQLGRGAFLWGVG